MPKLGEYLVQPGALDAAQFEEAYRAQRVHGRRIGANLVEQGFQVLDELAEYLAALHDTPMLPPEWLEEADPRALKLVPMALIRRFNFLPLKLERECIHVAMIDPTDALQLDFLNASASRPVCTYVLPEVRIL